MVIHATNRVKVTIVHGLQLENLSGSEPLPSSFLTLQNVVSELANHSSIIKDGVHRTRFRVITLNLPSPL